MKPLKFLKPPVKLLRWVAHSGFRLRLKGLDPILKGWMASEQQSHAAYLWPDAKGRYLIGQMRRLRMGLEPLQGAHHFLLIGQICPTLIGGEFPPA